MPMEHHAGSFIAYDAQGNRHTIVKIHQEGAQSTNADPHGTGIVGRRLALESGEHVNRTSKGVYVVPDLDDLVLRSNDPEAP